jgi:6-phosphogluconolactonase
MPEIEIMPDAASLAQRAADQFIGLAEYAIHKRGRFVVALSGGSTPKLMNAMLAESLFSDWSKVFVFWSDERCVPPDHKVSNYRMARETLLNRVPVPDENIHRIRGENSADRAARVYEDELRDFFVQPGGSSTPPGFDLILLGLGDDGHTASLFPGAPGIHENRRWSLAVKHNIPPLPLVDRVTFTPSLINAAANVTFLVSGAAKAERLRQVLRDPYNPDRFPAQVVCPKAGKLFWLLDEAAAGKIK